MVQKLGLVLPGPNSPGAHSQARGKAALAPSALKSLPSPLGKGIAALDPLQLGWTGPGSQGEGLEACGQLCLGSTSPGAHCEDRGIGPLLLPFNRALASPLFRSPGPCLRTWEELTREANSMSILHLDKWAPFPTLERLDQALVSLDWHLLFPRSSLKARPRPRSDHCPLLLSVSIFVPQARIFRFESFWLNFPSVFQTVTDAWTSYPTSPEEPINSLSRKLSNVRQALLSWSSGRTSLLRMQADSCLHWLGWLDTAEDRRELSLRETMLRLHLKGRHEVLCLQEEIYWKQRSTVQWLKAGDANTKFFHIRANCRRNRNCISRLSDGIDSFSSHEAIANHLFFFYRSQLGVAFSTWMSIQLRSLFGSGGLDLFFLHLPFTMEEVKSVVFSSAPEKAPGPDGFPMLFYQRFWNILKHDLFDVFTRFHDGPLNLRDIN
uniref:Reverse transcriptase n=1 Tax=Ananas comosus var. bracteatus TaxID=296719 RepID=A0A6V7QBX1_ANACO|nr:unnamed protein product [Ananas comosus var. bracteatus]